jgi:hypothetical protein
VQQPDLKQQPFMNDCTGKMDGCYAKSFEGINIVSSNTKEKTQRIANDQDALKKRETFGGMWD